MKTKNAGVIMQNTVFAWIAAGAALVLSLPLIAMQFTKEIDWSFGDFIIIGTLLFGSGSLFVLVARKTKKNRLAIGIVFFLAVLYIWAELAVGIFTNLGS